MAKELGAKRGRGPGSFVQESKQQTSDFYRTIVQGLRPWTATAPKLPPSPTPPARPAEASSDPPTFTSEEREFGEATEPDS